MLYFTWNKFKVFLKYFVHGGGRYHIETSPLIYGANQRTGFYMITASVMKELKSYFKGMTGFYMITASVMKGLNTLSMIIVWPLDLK